MSWNPEIIFRKHPLLDKPVIAIDFDGTLTLKDHRKWKKVLGFNISYDDYFEPNIEVEDWIIKNRDKFYLVLWSVRTGRDLKRAVDWCSNRFIFFDAVNKNIFPEKTSKKIYADIYIDDKGCNFLPRISES